MSKTGRKERNWRARIDKVPGLEADLNKLMLETGSHSHDELLSKLSFAHRHVKTIDKLYKLMLKPDQECSKREILAKQIILKLYHFSGVTTPDLAEEILAELDKASGGKK